MQVGEAVMVKFSTIGAIYLGALPTGKAIIWNGGAIRTCSHELLQSWRCTRCQGVECWWTSQRGPTCTTCSPMPTSVAEEVWRELDAYVTELERTKKNHDDPTLYRDGLNVAIMQGNRALLQRFVFFKVLQDLGRATQ